MKRYFMKNLDYGEFNVSRKSLTIQPNLNSSSNQDFKYRKTNCLNRTFVNRGFRIYLPNHPEPQWI